MPLYTILLAMGNPTVHHFSLDIEGAEFPILKTIPWDKVAVKLSHQPWLKNNNKPQPDLHKYLRQDITEPLVGKVANTLCESQLPFTKVTLFKFTNFENH